MAKLSYQQRKSMSKKSFALPSQKEGGKGGYPIPDIEHGRNALARVAQHGSPSEKKIVRAKVHAKFPSIQSMHTGGVVSSDGVYRLKKGETVVPASSGHTGHWEVNGSEKKFVYD